MKRSRGGGRSKRDTVVEVGKEVFVHEMNALISYHFNPQCTVGKTMKSTRRVLGHSLLRSLVRSHRSLIRLPRTARFARALRYAHSLARSLTHSLQNSWERDLCLWIQCVNFIQFRTIVRWRKAREKTVNLCRDKSIERDLACWLPILFLHSFLLSTL